MHVSAYLSSAGYLGTQHSVLPMKTKQQQSVFLSIKSIKDM